MNILKNKLILSLVSSLILFQNSYGGLFSRAGQSSYALRNQVSNYATKAKQKAQSGIMMGQTNIDYLTASNPFIASATISAILSALIFQLIERSNNQKLNRMACLSENQASFGLPPDTFFKTYDYSIYED